MESLKPFEFFISAKGGIVVLTMIGPMNDRALPALADLQKEVGDQAAVNVVVLNLRDVGDVSGDAIPFLAQFQKALRSRPAEIRFCGIRPELKSKLLSRGIVRTMEIFDNLQIAIQMPVKTVSKRSA